MQAMEHPAFDNPAPHWSAAWQELWMLPIILGTCWWDLVVEALWPHLKAVSVRHEDHDQLCIPMPIAEETEQGLFA
ncbi:hypothetical protein [Flavisphingomonas formosensis]|uniref:hypothetical protein n=1 Tax=Flavisphingomonas formosensis TaxID=861534 RepID=UPI0012F98E53|nr:hypothetical protein [Sphingomonas formosensis]